MRLTDIENFARRLPTRAHFHQPPNGSNEGSMNAAHLTDVPPYESFHVKISRRWQTSSEKYICALADLAE
jgi:hypothetical protein